MSVLLSSCYTQTAKDHQAATPGSRPYQAWGDQPPPEGFAGNNDWWHLHRKICFGTGGILAGAEEIPDEECAALGGRQATVPNGGHWLLHVWMVPGPLPGTGHDDHDPHAH